MKNPLALWRDKKNVQKSQDFKERIVKNRAGVLDAFAENIQGARQCPFLLGQKCMGVMCEFFVEYKNIGPDGKEMVYRKCNINQTPNLLIENATLLRTLINEQRATQKLMIDLHELRRKNNADDAGK